MYNQYNPEAFAHYEKGVRLGFVKKNPLTMPQSEKFQEAEKTVRQLNARTGRNDWYTKPDGSVMATKEFMEMVRKAPEMSQSESIAYTGQLAAKKYREGMNSQMSEQDRWTNLSRAARRMKR